VVAIPPRSLVEKVKVGNCSGRDNDKFNRLGLTSLQANLVHAPLTRGCFCDLEWLVTDTNLIPRHNLFMLEAVRAWIDHDNPRQVPIMPCLRGAMLQRYQQ
jgi:flavin reductase (DIM6/NTAB) family NADH-FMN oxidoreductase RutF